MVTSFDELINSLTKLIDAKDYLIASRVCKLIAELCEERLNESSNIHKTITKP
jgi:dihydroneopterin aldolase